MTSIEEVADHLPDPVVPVGAYLAGHGLSPRRVQIHERYLGFREIRLDPHRTWPDQAVAAAAGLSRLASRRADVHYVLQARTMPVAAPHPLNPLQEVRRRLGLTHAVAVCVSQQACASALLAVELAGRLLTQDGDRDGLVLVLTGEKAFTTGAQIISDTGVMGEGTAAVLVGIRDDSGDRMLSYTSRSHGDYRPSAGSLADASACLHEAYPDALVDVYLRAVAAAGLRPADVDWVLPHHANRLAWQRVTRRIGLRDPERVLLGNLPRFGHCFGADSFLNYATLRRSGSLRRGEHYVMTAVGAGVTFATSGLGATFAAMVFRH